MKILLVGPGSIGQRHLRNIILLGYTDIAVVSRSGSIAEFSACTFYNTLSEAINRGLYDAAILCTPTAFHLPALQALLQANIPNIYIEKPISHSYHDMDAIIALQAIHQTNIVVGYDLHFEPGLQKVKTLIDGGIAGKIVSVNAQVGQYLPDWRPAQDYTKTMSAKIESGGGVMLDLVHEFDYLIWLIGSPQLVGCFNTNTQSLQIETEDIAEVLIRFTTGCVGTIHLDYLQQKLVRNCMFTGTAGSIFWNLAESKVAWIGADKMEHSFSYETFSRNDRFIEIMKSFLSGNNDPRLTNLFDGLKSLQCVLAAKASAQTQQFIDMRTHNFIPAL